MDGILEELEGTEEDTWFPKPLGRDITTKGLDNFVKTFMKKYGGIINSKTPKRHFDKIIKKYESIMAGAVIHLIRNDYPACAQLAIDATAGMADGDADFGVCYVKKNALYSISP